MTSNLEKERAYSQRKRQVREEISKEKVKKKRKSREAYNISKATQKRFLTKMQAIASMPPKLHRT